MRVCAGTGTMVAPLRPAIDPYDRVRRQRAGCCGAAEWYDWPVAVTQVYGIGRWLNRLSPKLALRGIVAWATASWVFQFWLLDHFSRTRPVTSHGGFTHLLKTVTNVVYLNDADDRLECIAISMAVFSSLAFLALAFFRVESEGDPPSYL